MSSVYSNSDATCSPTKTDRENMKKQWPVVYNLPDIGNRKMINYGIDCNFIFYLEYWRFYNIGN